MDFIGDGKQDYIGLSSEDSSSSAMDTELNLGLSLGGGGGKVKASSYGRILTAQDFISIGSSSSSSCSGKTDVTSPLVAKSAVSGLKRSAESIAQEGSANGAVSNQLVGWPPLRNSRINILVNHTKNPSFEDDKMAVEASKNEDITRKKTDDRTNTGNVTKKCHIVHSLFVKVNMDGVPIGRKVDLSSHNCYETLAKTLEDMFFNKPTSTNATNFIGSTEEEENGAQAQKASQLLGGSSEFVLTYEDKDGDWMLVGDVPWGMFLNSAKRLRIMRTSDANGLAPRIHNIGDRQRKKPI